MGWVLKSRSGNYRKRRPTAKMPEQTHRLDAPSPTISASGIAGCYISGHSLELAEEETEMEQQPDPSKPPYRVPLVSEIRKIKPNGFKVATTFAGAGGSSTGYRLAGFQVVWANEFVPIAQESYRANAMPYTTVDGRDIKQVTAADILAATGLARGELDVFDGSPPCQAFSTAGKREKGWGTDRHYEHGASQKNEELFFDYIRLRDGLKPKVFVAENVSGLVKGTAKGFFLEILKELRRGYRVTAPLLDAQWLGVPQARQRIVFIGVRDDIEIEPPVIRPLPYRYSVRDALPWLGPARLVTAGNERHTAAGRRPTWNADTKPSPTIMATPASESYRVVHDTRGSFKSGGDITDRPSVTIMSSPFDAHHFQVHGPVEVRKIANGDSVPENVAASLEGYAVGSEWDKLNPGQASDRFFSLVRPDSELPCPTITSQGAGGSGSGAPGGVASVTHPTEKRKFTILEVKRLCSFPDDFELKGTYAQQWERLGNSVPPVMMQHVAEAIRDGVLAPARARTSAPAQPPAGRSTTDKPRRGGGTSPPDGPRADPRPARASPGRRRPATPPAPEERAGGASQRAGRPPGGEPPRSGRRRPSPASPGSGRPG